MGILGKILGGDNVAKPIEAVGNIVDELFTSKEEKLTHEEMKMRILQKPSLIQTEINKIEAQHRSIFVAGWRPFIGWVCGSALLYNFIIRDLIGWVILNLGVDVSLPPALQMDHLITVLVGMLGLGGLRTWEKFKGKTK
jgi:hypothetical protein